MNDIEKMRDELNKKIEYVDKLIIECEALKKEWEKRINEAYESKQNFDQLLKYLESENN